MSRMARMQRPYLERTNMNMQVMQTMMARAATHRYCIFSSLEKPRPVAYSEEDAEPWDRPCWPQKGRLLIRLTMIMPKPRVMMAR